MSTITLDEYEKAPVKWAQAAAESGEAVLVTKGGQPLVKITAAVPPVRKSVPLPDREEEIRKLPVTDSTRYIEEFRANRDL